MKREKSRSSGYCRRVYREHKLDDLIEDELID